MRRIRIAGLCLVAVFAMSAIASATASAEAPEFGKCTKVSGANSNYSDKGCTKEVAKGTGAYEWVGGAAGVKFSTTGGVATLLTVKGESVTCSNENSTGTYLGGNNKEEETTVNFTGCKSNGLTCTTTGDASGELTTNPLIGIVGFEKTPGPKGRKTVLQLHPAASGGHFIDFKCTSALTIEVRGAEGANGGILVKIKNDKMVSKEVLKYTQSKGKQKPTVWVPPTGYQKNQFLESNFQGTGFGQSGQSITSTVENEGKALLELNAFV